MIQYPSKADLDLIAALAFLDKLTAEDDEPDIADEANAEHTGRCFDVDFFDD